MKPKRILLYIFSFAFFMVMTACALMIIVGSIRCVDCLLKLTEPSLLEWASLLIVSIIGATVGVVYEICDVEVD